MNTGLALLIACSLAGCALTSAPVKPRLDIPAAFTEVPTPGIAGATEGGDAGWWRAFEVGELAALVDEALASSPDLAIATERVIQAEGQARVAGASLFPALNIGVSASRRDSRPEGGPTSRSESSSINLNASYEFDFWGGNAATARSARLAAEASRFDRETARLTLAGGVANGFFQVVSLRGRMAIARANLAIAERVLGVVEARERNGAVSPLDVARQQTAVLAQRAVIPALELQERQTRYALAILVGRTPEGFAIAGADLAAVTTPVVSAGLPSELLLRRPDLAAAEVQLAAGNANVVAARAALFPNIGLTGSLGLASDRLVNVLHSPTAVAAIGASLLQPIFDGGRLRAQVDMARSRERELAETYRKTILAALADVESALAAAARSAEQEQLQQQALEQSRRVLRIAEVRYREGVDDLLSALDAQRTSFQAEDQLAQTRLARLQAAVALYKALGGGWRLDRGAPSH
jgi:NodT family efflux transporter outer membrane factor (OMF) lipoprotein